MRTGAYGLAATCAWQTGNSRNYDASQPPQTLAIPDKLVVLTFDDAVKSQRTFVAPLLKELGFGATFFVTHRWMGDHENFMTWNEIAEIHQMGFEIGNHTWTHDDFSTPKITARLAGELALVERELERVGVPRPVSFAYPGNVFGPEAAKEVMNAGYKFGRRGITPEVDYQIFGQNQPGSTYDPVRHHPLLIPSAGILDLAYKMEDFQRIVERAQNGQVVVWQIHGVPDLAHPWVHSPPEDFRRYMIFLKDRGYRVIPVRDLERYVVLEKPPIDPTLQVRYPEYKYGCLPLPIEVEATRGEMCYWLENTLRYHHYSLTEAAQVSGMAEAQVREKATDFRLYPPPAVESAGKKLRVLPYPGGRHPRIGSLERAINPMRGTKASVFLPWDPTSYVLVDLPEAIFGNLGLIFLAHTDIPTVWNDQNLVLENVDWTREPGTGLSNRWYLENGIVFGTSIKPLEDHVDMELWLANMSGKNLTGLRTQVCSLLKGASEFNGQTNDNKIFRRPTVAVRSTKGDRWILTAWERCGRVWGNALCPCMHSDPVLPDCPFGHTVRTRGILWFYEGHDIEQELARGRASFASAGRP